MNVFPKFRVALALAACTFAAHGQQQIADAAPLPAAPSALLAQDAPLRASTSSTSPSGKPKVLANKYSSVIDDYETAQPLTSHDKLLVGARDLYSVGNFAAMFASAGYSHLTNGQPNFGTDKGAFGQRLGVAAVRETAQGVFTEMIFAPAFHQDPRYYVMGDSQNAFKRTAYSITRPIIGRSDGGRSVPNASLLLGYAAATAVTTPMGPQINRNFKDAAAAYGGSIGGAAVGFFVQEFIADALVAVHLKKPH